MMVVVGIRGYMGLCLLGTFLIIRGGLRQLKWPISKRGEERRGGGEGEEGYYLFLFLYFEKLIKSILN